MGITCVELPAAEMGKQASQKLIYKIEDNQPIPTISLRGNIKESQSVPDAKQLENRWTLTSLWAISLTGPIISPPQVTALPRGDMPREDQEMPVQLTWEFPSTTFKVRIDPKHFGINCETELR